jgi:hypothetical protein
VGGGGRTMNGHAQVLEMGNQIQSVMIFTSTLLSNGEMLFV